MPTQSLLYLCILSSRSYIFIFSVHVCSISTVQVYSNSTANALLPLLSMSIQFPLFTLRNKHLSPEQGTIHSISKQCNLSVNGCPGGEEDKGPVSVQATNAYLPADFYCPTAPSHHNTNKHLADVLLLLLLQSTPHHHHATMAATTAIIAATKAAPTTTNPAALKLEHLLASAAGEHKTALLLNVRAPSSSKSPNHLPNPWTFPSTRQRNTQYTLAHPSTRFNSL
ncbi:hypothetical protein CC80DRAFT_257342 [Byssothecium circinans]|uniref:Uncharacterized protein n=1 Tax=Byssothecium circinans TaxID=147558 RepID=A0A6A5TBF4_9PLEO|nr:hypothetical protein CC80DRAFT_257342 [Byssothecium circinans]